MNSSSDAPPIIPENATLWRRIPPIHAVRDGSGWRPSSAAFDDDVGGMSVCVAEIAASPDEMMRDHEDFGLVAFPISALGDHGFSIRLDEEGTYKGHAVVTGQMTGSARKKAAKAIAKSAQWVCLPKGIR